MKQTKAILHYGWIDLIIFCLTLLWLGLLIYLFLDQNPTPSRIWYHQLSRESINNGEGDILIAYWIFISLLITFVTLHLFFTGLICYRTLIFLKTKSGTSQQHYWSSPLVNQVSYGLIIGLGLLVPFLLAFYLFRKEKLYYFSLTSNVALQALPLQQKKKLILFTSGLLVFLIHASFIGLPLIMVYFHQSKPYYRHANAKRFYQLAQTGNNCLYFHFKGVGGSQVEQLFRSNRQLANTFRDFTIYQNHLSLSNRTLTSLPTLTFGYHGLIVEKQNLTSSIKHLVLNSLDQTARVDFPGSCLVGINQLSLNDYYKLCLANFVAAWHYLGYEIVNICGFPYYGKQSPWLTYPNNTQAMNEQMRHQYGFKNFTGVCASELLAYKQQQVHYNNLDDANVISQLGNDWEISNNFRSVFWAIYSQQTAKTGVIKNQQNRYVPTFDRIPLAIKNAFSDLSQIIKKLKEHDVYQNTSIIITSDYSSNSKEQSNQNWKETAGNYAPIFMVKIGQTSQPKLMINNQALITSADQLAFIRNLLYPNWKPTSPDPFNPLHRFQEKYHFFNLYQSTNTYHSTSSWSRQLSLFQPLDQRYLWWRKDLQMAKIDHFRYDSSHRKSIFDKLNWIEE